MINRLYHIVNITNLIFQNNLGVTFVINASDQTTVINSDKFDNINDNNLDSYFQTGATTTFTSLFNEIIDDPSSYHIGHVLSQGSGGLAFLGSVCRDDIKRWWLDFCPRCL